MRTQGMHTCETRGEISRLTLSSDGPMMGQAGRGSAIGWLDAHRDPMRLTDLPSNDSALILPVRTVEL